MIQYTKTAARLLSLLVSLFLLSSNSYAQGGAAAKTPVPSTNPPAKSSQPVKRVSSSSRVSRPASAGPGSNAAEPALTARQLAAKKHFETAEKMLSEAKCHGCGDKTSYEVILVDAINEYRLAAQLDPGSAYYRLYLGSRLSDLKKHDEAELELRKAVEIDPEDAEAHRALAKALRDQKKLAQAEAEYRLAVTLKPNNWVHHDELGMSLLLQQKYSEAEAEYRTGLRLYEPTCCTLSRADMYKWLGVTLYYQNKSMEAQTTLEKAIEYLSKEGVEYFLAEGHFWLARVFKQQNNLPRAENEYRKTLQLNPQRDMAQEELNEVMRLQGK